MHVARTDAPDPFRPHACGRANAFRGRSWRGRECDVDDRPKRRVARPIERRPRSSKRIVARRLRREEAHRPRAPPRGPDSRRQHRPHASGGQVRLQTRLQVLDVCDVVDSSGDHACHRGPRSYHPNARAYGRDGESPGLCPQPSRSARRPGAHHPRARGGGRSLRRRRRRSR